MFLPSTQLVCNHTSSYCFSKIL